MYFHITSVLSLAMILSIVFGCNLNIQTTDANSGDATVVGRNYIKNENSIHTELRSEDSAILELKSDLQGIVESLQQLSTQYSDQKTFWQESQNNLQKKINQLQQKQNQQQTLTWHDQQMTEMLGFVQAFCGKYERSGHEQHSAIEGQLSANLNGFFKRLAQMSGQLGAQKTNTHFKNVQVDDLIHELNNNRECRITLLQTLIQHFRTTTG